jgi:methionyl-tRNA formyltransferase
VKDVPTASTEVLMLTMPGFGIETLKRLHASPDWRVTDVRVVLIGARPQWTRQVAAWLRLRCTGDSHPRASLADHTLAAAEAARWLEEAGYSFRWLSTDAEVRSLRTQLAPRLTLTITSRLIFSEQTLSCCLNDWWNVHPGILPEYAGASPVPYMYVDRRAGCSIHRMAARVDAGPLLDVAELTGDMGGDGGELLFDRLPELAASRVLALLSIWRSGQTLPELTRSAPLVHRSAARLARDRRLDWRCDAGILERWVKALMPYAPAQLVDSDGRSFAVVDAASSMTNDPHAPGTVLKRDSGTMTVATGHGILVLRCRGRPRADVGTVLPGVWDRA